MAKKFRQPANWKVGCALLMFALVIMGLGSLVANMMLIEPWQRHKEAALWKEVPCVVQELSVERHQMDRASSKHDSVAFSPKVVFVYRWEDREYTGKTFWLSNQLLKTADEARALIGSYEAGKTAMCWVNPNDAADAVLNRDISGVSLAGGIFGSILAFFGLLGAIGSVMLIFKKSTN